MVEKINTTIKQRLTTLCGLLKRLMTRRKAFPVTDNAPWLQLSLALKPADLI
jgi:hypothetical protein